MPQGTASLVGADATDRRWTYAELLAEAEDCARWLLESYTPGERVCIWAPNVPEWVIVQYGAALAGLVLVTANPALRASELRYVLRQSKAVGLIHADHFRGTDMAAIAREVSNEVRGTFCMANWQTAVRGKIRTGALPVVKPGDPAQVQYTSGTTGEPKGALLHSSRTGYQRQLCRRSRRIGQRRVRQSIAVVPYSEDRHERTWMRDDALDLRAAAAV